MWDSAREKERGNKDGAEICHKWRVDAECGRVYRYLGCVINEHVESKVMVDSRVRAGARALYMCLVEEVQSSCWRGSRGVICVAVGGNGAVSVVVQSRGMGIL